VRQLPNSTDYTKLASAIVSAVDTPAKVFASTVDTKLAEDFVNDYVDSLLPLTRKNQGTVPVSTTLPSQHNVDLGGARVLSLDESHELYNLFHLTHGVAHFVAPKSITNFSDSKHNLYRFSGDLTFDLLSQQQPPDIEDWLTNLQSGENPQATEVSLRISSFNIEQSSPLEEDSFYTAQTLANISDPLLASDGANKLILSRGGNVVVSKRVDVSFVQDGALALSLFPHDTNFSTGYSKQNCDELIFNGARYAIVYDNRVVKTGTLNYPVWQAEPFFFAGHFGWLVIAGGSTTNLTLGEVSGGELLFISRTYSTQIKPYVNAVPTSLYIDRNTVYVAVALETQLRLDVFNGSLKALASTSYAATDSAIVNFIVHNAKLYGLVCGLRGNIYSPQLIDFEESQVISFTTQTFTAPSQWRPHFQIVRKEQMIVDFEKTNPGTELSASAEYSYAAQTPLQADYDANPRYWVLTFNREFNIVPLRVKAAGAVQIAKFTEGNIVQSGDTIYRVYFVPTYNMVVPNVRFVRIHTLREFTTNFRTLEETGLPTNTARIHYNGNSYSVSTVSIGSFYLTWQIVGVVERKNKLFAVIGAKTTSGIVKYFLRQMTIVAPTALDRVIRISDSVTNLAGYQEIVADSNTHLVSKFADTFNVEKINVNRLYDAERAHWRPEYFTKYSTTLDVGVVLRETQTDTAQYSELYLPNIQVSTVEFFSDLSADNVTLTGDRYDFNSPEKLVFSALGTSEFPGDKNPLVDAEVDILTFGYPAILTQSATSATTGQGIFRVFSGRVESVETDGGQVSVKCIGALEMLSQPYKDVTSASCTYKFGGIRCGVQLTKTYGTITSATRNYLVVNMNSILPLSAVLYKQGTLRFMDAGFQNVEVDVATVASLGGTIYRIELFSTLDYVPPNGALVVLSNGCTKTMVDCAAYNNLERGRQMPYLQGARTFTASGMINDSID